MTLSVLTLNAPPLLDLAVPTEREAIVRTAGLLQGRPEISNFAGFVAAVLERQRINPPILGNGVAMPHARTALVSEIVCVAARCAVAVPFGSELKPVRLIFVFGIPPRQISQYLAVTAALVRRLRNPEVLERLLAADTREEFLRWLE